MQITGLENTYPAWSPDRRFVIYASEQDGNLDVFRMKADGSEKVNLSRHPGTDGHPRVSPDGRLIYFNSNRSSDPATFSRGTMDRDHNHEIYAMTLDGEQLLWRRIAPTGGKSESGRNSEVFWMDLQTGVQKNLTANQAYDGWPAWAPDGRQIAFASNRANVEFEAFAIHVADVDGSNPVRVTFGDGIEGRGSWTKPSFSADGKSILCTRSVGTSVDIFVIALNSPGDPLRNP